MKKILLAPENRRRLAAELGSYAIHHEEIPDYLQGDKQIPSTDKKLRAVKPKVEEVITVFMR